MVDENKQDNNEIDSEPNDNLDQKASLESEVELDDEIIELEFDEDSVEYYIDDEDGNEIGVCLNEDGELVEYMYEDESISSNTENSEDVNEEDNILAGQVKIVSDSLNETKDELLDCKDDAIAVARELKDTAGDLKEMYDDLVGGLNPLKRKK